MRIYDNLIRWLLIRLAAMDHGCLTGDCPHEKQDECVASIREAYYDDCDGEE
uniref:Uncharacterized protein n=1 Tax=viral metagenome TaxID=1070528 RepID=A0A6M3JXH9_9ZZZZ